MRLGAGYWASSSARASDYVTIQLDAPIGGQKLMSVDDPMRVRPMELADVHPGGVPDAIIAPVPRGKTQSHQADLLEWCDALDEGRLLAKLKK